MKLLTLRVSNLAAIANVQVDFGPGLNVLYGPNDLGKSTLVDSIRLALLLPHASTYCDPYIPWAGSGDPIVDLTFETEPQRIYRVKKVFGKGGSSLLQESRNGKDFDKLAQGRSVDGELRKILHWGIPEPGGAGGSKGLPPSFLATALLSTQADVAAMLHESLEIDGSSTGKERIAAALQAVARDPQFLSILSCAQARRDQGYTDRGARKTGKESVFRVAAERLRAAREEKEDLENKVAYSQGAEKNLQRLLTQRLERQDALSAASERLAELQRLEKEAADCASAAQDVCRAQQEVARIERLGANRRDAEATVAAMLQGIAQAEQSLEAAQNRHVKAAQALTHAEETARSESANPQLNDAVLRKDLELRRAAAEHGLTTEHARIDAAASAQKLVSAADDAERACHQQQQRAARARTLLSQAVQQETAANGELHYCDVLERALDVQMAAKREEQARAALHRETELRDRFEVVSREHAEKVQARNAFAIPKSAELLRLRKLAADLAASQRALEVGLLVTVAPTKELELIISKDGAAASSTSTAQPLDIEADGELELAIPGIATLHVRGGRRQAQEGARLLQDRWQQEVVPHFIRAGVTDMEGLERRLGDGQELDASITAKDAELKSLNREIAALSRAADDLREASNHLNVCRAALTTVDVSESLDDSLSALKELGADAISSLRERRRKAMLQAEVARKTASKAQNDVSLEEDRARNLELALTEAIRMRDNALTAFPNGLAADLATARKAVVAANTEREKVVGELASLDRTIQERKQHIDAMLADTRNENEEAKIAVGAAQRNFLDAKTGHASADATLAAVRKLFEAEDLAAALANLNEAQKRCAALPVPHRIITSSELTAAADKLRSLTFELQHLSGEIHKAQGALEQVGGAVVRERLRDAIEAFELAERLEKETEAEYEAWKLLLEQMKEADAAQASNLGQVLAPAIASRFQDLTQKRYETVCLNPHLGTEGVLVGGTVRDTERISVGTREQLSTLYRLCLAEYLQTMIVLDDQLVQSDETRMDWFRSLLTEKACSFQILVFTCRPADYIARSAMAPNGNTMYADSDDGLIRAINLERVLNGAHGL